MTTKPDDLADAPEPVRQAAAWVAKNRLRARIAAASMASVAFGALGMTGILHDVAGWSEFASAAPLPVAGLVLAAGFVWILRGPLRHMASREAMVARWRQLRALGLDPRGPAAHDEDTTAIDRLHDRIAALAGDNEGVLRAATQARDRARRLDAELAHLDATMAQDPDLAEQLTGVRERVDVEVSGIRARLAETWAALIELDAAEADADGALRSALTKVASDLEVAGSDDTKRRREATERARRAAGQRE